jgi:hypothetical protein
MKTFTLYADPGHAWAKVPVELLVELKIAEKISQYSYRRNADAYLEEDCDLATFMLAYRAAYGKNPHFIEKNSNRDSRIRSYSRYHR